MESSGVIENHRTSGAGSAHRIQLSVNALEPGSSIRGSLPIKPSTVRNRMPSATATAGVVPEKLGRNLEADLLVELDSIAWSWRQRLAIVCVIVCTIGFAVYSYRDSEAQLYRQAWTEGRDAGKLAAVDPIHNIVCPYHDLRTSNAWREGFREGHRLGSNQAVAGKQQSSNPPQSDVGATAR